MKVEFVKYGKILDKTAIDFLSSQGQYFLVKTLERESSYDCTKHRNVTKTVVRIQILSICSHLITLGGDFFYPHIVNTLVLDGYIPLEFEQEDLSFVRII